MLWPNGHHTRGPGAAHGYDGNMEVRVLGTVEVATGGTWIPIDVPKERALVATLALGAGRTVAHARLVDALWGAVPPDTADKMLQWHVSHVRKTVGHDAVETIAPGYALAVDPPDVDALRFAMLVNEGSNLVRGRHYQAAIDRLSAALDLWRGPPLQDLADSEFRTGQQRRFEELHELARERWIDSHLGLGHADVMVAELESVVTEHPYREGRWSALILALYRCGRQADALRAYQRFRRRLAEDLGIEPTDAMRRLEERILRQDPLLDTNGRASGANKGNDVAGGMIRASTRQAPPATTGPGSNR
jgi:DNA-binding SARP family transcriptional activator